MRLDDIREKPIRSAWEIIVLISQFNGKRYSFDSFLDTVTPAAYQV